MVDLHCHLIPGVDDGPTTEAESLEMMKVAIQEGITVIAATPHHLNGKYINNREDILKAVEQLNGLVKSHQLPLKIVPGQEIRINGQFEEDYDNEKIVTVGGNTQYVLVELPSNHVPRYATRLFYDIQLKNLRPIIVHPERNSEIIKNPEKLMQFIEKGALVQVTAASITGCFGKKIQKFSFKLIEANAVQIIASDAHNITSRGFQMKGATQLLKKKYGSDYVESLLTNAQHILANKVVVPSLPESMERKKLWGILPIYF